MRTGVLREDFKYMRPPVHELGVRLHPCHPQATVGMGTWLSEEQAHFHHIVFVLPANANTLLGLKLV